MKAKAFKKITVAVCLIVITAVSAVAVAYAAAPAPVFTVNGASQLHPGDEVTITVSVNDSRGFCAGEFVLGYDSDALTPIGVEGGEAASEYFVGNEEYADGEVYFAVIDETLMTDGGTLANVTFKVNDNVVLYSGDLTLSVPTLVGNVSVNYGFNKVKSTVKNGEIHASKRIFVPDANDADAKEELALSLETSGYVLGASTYLNLTQSALASNFSTITTMFYGADLNRLPASARLSTGCRIKIFDNSGASNTLVMSVAGDVDGNCTKDANDAFLVGMIEGGYITEDDIGSAYSKAADVDSDGVIDDNDFKTAVETPLN